MINLYSEVTAKMVVKFIEDNKDRIDTNQKLFDIYEGDIGTLLADKMKADLGEKSFLQAKERMCPVNVLKRILDKLSKIYQQEPKREVVNGVESDKKILDKFEELLNINHKFNTNNELWNLYLNSLIQIGNINGKPFIRSIPNHKFLIMNTSEVDPTSPDIVILFMGASTDDLGKIIQTYWVYTDEQFCIYDSTKIIRYDLLTALGQDGTIPTNSKPFCYLNASENLAMPKIQNDTLDMTLLIPLLLSDTGYIAKFSTYSIMYGIDVDDKNMTMGPNVFWNFSSDPESDKNPSVGTIKPEGDIDQLIKLAISQMSIWLDTKGIKVGSIGNATVDNAASGISKLIDEADVTEIRNFQATIYGIFERNFWDLLLHKLYPFWIEQGLIDNYGTFSPNASVSVSFKPQTPLVDKGEQVKILNEEVLAGFTTKRRAIMELNPDMTEKEIDELMAEIDSETEVMVINNGNESNIAEQNGNENNTSDTIGDNGIS